MLIHIKQVHSSLSYKSAIYTKYDWCGHESPSGYGPLCGPNPSILCMDAPVGIREEASAP